MLEYIIVIMLYLTNHYIFNTIIYWLIDSFYLFLWFQICLSRVVLALKNYSRIFGDSGIFQGQNTNCEKWRANATDIADVAEQILETLKVKFILKSVFALRIKGILWYKKS